jgi:hypothetical protein
MIFFTFAAAAVVAATTTFFTLEAAAAAALEGRPLERQTPSEQRMINENIEHTWEALRERVDCRCSGNRGKERSAEKRGSGEHRQLTALFIPQVRLSSDQFS